MRAKTVLTLILLSLASTVLPVAAGTPKTTGPAEPIVQAAEPQYVVYYFHGNQRCRTCMRIESATEQTVRSRFDKELKAKRLEWRVVNFDKPENEHVIKDYGLVAQSVVLVEYRGGKQVRFKNLDRVWRLIHEDDAAFEAYIRDELRAFMDHHA